MNLTPEQLAFAPYVVAALLSLVTLLLTLTGFLMKRTLDRIEMDLRALMIASGREEISHVRLEVRVQRLEDELMARNRPTPTTGA